MFKWRKLLIFTGIIFTISFMVFNFYLKREEVKVYKVKRDTVKSVIEDTGRIELREKHLISTNQGGKIQKLNVEVGDRVEPGQLLGWLSQRNTLLKQKEAAQYALEAAKAQAEIVITEKPEYKLLKANLLQAQTSYEKAKRSYERGKVLYEMGAISKEEFYDLEDTYFYQEKNLAAVKSQVNSLELGSQEKDVLFQLANAQANLLMITEKLVDAELITNMEGTVTQIYFKENQVAPPGSVVLEIGDLTTKELKANILADKIMDAQPGLEVEIYGDLLEKNEIIKGKITEIAPVAVLSHSLLGAEEFRVPVTVSIDRQDRRLIPGSEMDIRIVKEKKDDVITINKNSLFTLNGEDFVFIVNKGRIHLQKVVTGLKGKDIIEVKEGLIEGDVVVSDPADELKPGQRVKVKMLQ